MKHLLTLLAVLLPTAALAHPGHEIGFGAGVLHPLGGADHILAMVGLGLWAASHSAAGRWAMPVTFVTAMAAAFALVLPMPIVEPLILASVILLGAAIGFAFRAPLAVALPLVAVMGFAHGTAHADAASGLTFAVGMIAATAALYGLGALLGLMLHRNARRAAGALTLIAGAWLAMAGVTP